MIGSFDLEQAVRDIYRALDSDEVLEKTAEAIQAGWTQGTLGGRDALTGQQVVCLLGGVAKACFGDATVLDMSHRNYPAYVEALERLRVALRGKMLDLGHDVRALDSITDAQSMIPLYNDDSRVTKEDVLLVVKEALNTPEDTEE